MSEHLVWWVGLLLVGFAGSALYSGLETGAYRLNRVRLHILSHQERRSAVTLRRMVQNPTLLLSTLLIGNNVANQAGTASLAVILDRYGLGPWQVIALNTVIVTPLLFVFGETLPKDLFSAYADRLMYRLTPLLTASRWAFTVTGLVPLVVAFSWVMMRMIGGRGTFAPAHPRRQIVTLVREGVGYGLLSDDQSAIVSRVLELGERTVATAMVPWRRVDKLRDIDSPRQLRETAERCGRSRLPVIDRGGHVVGVVALMDALLREPDEGPPIKQLMSPPITIAGKTPLRAALGRMQRRRAALAVVTGERQEPIGVVTIKDLVEPITGELSNW